jgi:hypothetical protein
MQIKSVSINFLHQMQWHPVKAKGESKKIDSFLIVWLHLPRKN